MSTEIAEPLDDPALDVGECSRCEALAKSAISLRHRLTELESRFELAHHTSPEGCGYCRGFARALRLLRVRLDAKEVKFKLLLKRLADLDAAHKKALAEIERLKGQLATPKAEP